MRNYTRYPEVEVVYSTGIKPTKEKLKKISATHSTPIQLESNNGPPFNSKEFAEFASMEGFKHHQITPLHPRANDEAENSMKLVNKTEQRVQIQRIPTKIVMQEMLTGYRSTPHLGTGITPYEGMMNRHVRTKLDYKSRTMEKPNINEKHVNEQDKQYKERVKENAENRTTKEHDFKVGDYVFLEQTKKNKWSPSYESDVYIMYRIDRSTISVRRRRDGKEVGRDSSCFIRKESDQPDRREDILRKSKVNGNTERNNLAEEKTSETNTENADDERRETMEELTVEDEVENSGEQL